MVLLLSDEFLRDVSFNRLSKINLTVIEATATNNLENNMRS